MTYVADHGAALADLTDAGAAVTFTRTVPGAHDPLTGSVAPPSTVTVAGYAIEKRDRPENYVRLSIVGRPITLLFAPTTYGDRPEPGDSFSWGGRDATVREVVGVSPDGTAIALMIRGES